MIYQLWIEEDSCSQTFCSAGVEGESARKSLEKNARIVWTCEAESYSDAMTKYYKYMNWGEYKKME